MIEKVLLTAALALASVALVPQLIIRVNWFVASSITQTLDKAAGNKKWIEEEKGTNIPLPAPKAKRNLEVEESNSK